jgi:hypothetical protein
MTRFARYLIAATIFLVAAGGRAAPSSSPGFLEGHLKIVSLKTVQLAEDRVSKFAPVNYSEYPLLVLSKDGRNEVARIVADEDGHYRITLPPGDYILDAKGRAPQGIRAKPHPFTVVSQQTIRVDMEIDTGIR